jgi:hypothetical protein
LWANPPVISFTIDRLSTCVTLAVLIQPGTALFAQPMPGAKTLLLMLSSRSLMKR